MDKRTCQFQRGRLKVSTHIIGVNKKMKKMVLSGLLVASVLAGATQGVQAIEQNNTAGQGWFRPLTEVSARSQSVERKNADDIISRTLLTSESFTLEDLDGLREDGYEVYDLRESSEFNTAHIPETFKVDEADWDIEGGKVVFIIDGTVELKDVQKLVNKYKPDTVELAPIEKYDGRLQDLHGKEVSLGVLYKLLKTVDGVTWYQEGRGEAKPGTAGRAPADPMDKYKRKKDVDNVVGAEIGTRSGEAKPGPEGRAPVDPMDRYKRKKTLESIDGVGVGIRRSELESEEGRSTSESRETNSERDRVVSRGQNGLTRPETNDLQTKLKIEISKLDMRIETLRQESLRLKERLQESLQQTLEGNQEGELTIEGELERLDQLEEGEHSQYAVYIGDGLFLGLGGSAFATVGETIVHINEDEDVDLQLGGLYHFSTNGMVMMSYPSQINGKDIEQITEPVSFEVSRNILKGVNTFKKDINIEVVNVGQFNQVDGETKVTLGDIYSTKRVEDKNKILVVVGESRLDVEQASQMLLERGARVVIKVTNFVHVDEDFEQNVKEDLDRIEGELDSFIEEGKQFDIKDAAPDAIYYA